MTNDNSSINKDKILTSKMDTLNDVTLIKNRLKVCPICRQMLVLKNVVKLGVFSLKQKKEIERNINIELKWCTKCKNYYITDSILKEKLPADIIAKQIRLKPLNNKNSIENPFLNSEKVKNIITKTKKCKLIAVFQVECIFEGKLYNEMYGIVINKDLLNDENENCENIKTNETPFIINLNNAIAERKKEFVFDEAKYKIINYLTYQNGQLSNISKENSSKKVVDLKPTTKPQVIYIYSGRNSCQNRNHNINSVTASVMTLYHSSVNINIDSCETCKKYFINIKSLNEYEDKYGIIFFEGIFDESLLKQKKEYKDFRDQSELGKLGYTVSKDKNIKTKDRQRLLSKIIDNGWLEKTYIKSHIEYLIGSNCPTYIEAKEKWKEDLNFVNEYNIDKQKHIGKGKFKVHRQLSKQES